MASPHPPTARRQAVAPTAVFRGALAGLATELQDSVVQRIFTAGRTLRDAAAISVDPLVRRRIHKAIGDLDGAVRTLMAADLSLDRHGPRGEPAPAVGDWLAEGESALDLAAAALTRAGELNQNWRREFAADRRALGGKLAMLLGMVNGHGDTPLARPARHSPARLA